MFVIGKILKPQGIKGDVRVYPATDDPLRFKGMDKAHIELETQPEPLLLDIDHVRFQKKFAVIKFKGIDSMNAAERLRGGRICIDDHEALPLGADEYYVRDLFDMRVVADTGENLGVIADVLETGANDVYVVRQANAKDILIPAVKQFIISVDVKARIMTVKLIEGLR